MSDIVAVIDVGSNSIKLLVASPGDPLEILCQKTEEFRISSEINKQAFLSKFGLAKILECIQNLITQANPFKPKYVLIVATSAIREAANKDSFIEAVHAATGHPVYVLSGKEEALGIAKGVLIDPQFKDLKNFCLFDIGGGSLEMIRFCDRKVLTAVSLPLGAVRITQKHVQNPTLALPKNFLSIIDATVMEHMQEVHFPLDPTGGVLVGTGGAMNVASYVLEAQGQHISSKGIPVDALEHLYLQMAAIPLEARINIRGLPRKRADILPSALAVIISVARLLCTPAIHTSVYNLRFGLASSLLEKLSR